MYTLCFKEFPAGNFNLVADDRDIGVNHLVEPIQLLFDQVQFSRLGFRFVLPAIIILSFISHHRLTSYRLRLLTIKNFK